MSMFSEDFATSNDLYAEVFGEQVTLVRGLTETVTSVTAQATLQIYSGTDDDGIDRPLMSDILELFFPSGDVPQFDGAVFAS